MRHITFFLHVYVTVCRLVGVIGMFHGDFDIMFVSIVWTHDVEEKPHLKEKRLKEIQMKNWFKIDLTSFLS